MTGCLYISPPRDPRSPESGVAPALLADTLITWRVQGEVQRTPVKISPADNAKRSNVTLGRKLHIIGRCATAVAGDGPLIRELIETVRWNLPEWEKSDRPMRRYGDLANLYRQRGNIEAIGIWVPDMPAPINSMGCYRMEEIGRLGLCAAVGSGSADFLDRARKFEPQLEEMAWAPAEERIRGFASAINAARLVAELTGDITDKTGGYVEYVFYDHGNREWKRGPRSMNLFYELKRSGDKINVDLVPRVMLMNRDMEAEYYQSELTQGVVTA